MKTRSLYCIRSVSLSSSLVKAGRSRVYYLQVYLPAVIVFFLLALFDYVAYSDWEAVEWLKATVIFILTFSFFFLIYYLIDKWKKAVMPLISLDLDQEVLFINGRPYGLRDISEVRLLTIKKYKIMGLPYTDWGVLWRFNDGKEFFAADIYYRRLWLIKQFFHQRFEKQEDFHPFRIDCLPRSIPRDEQIILFGTPWWHSAAFFGFLAYTALIGGIIYIYGFAFNLASIILYLLLLAAGYIMFLHHSHICGVGTRLFVVQHKFLPWKKFYVPLEIIRKIIWMSRGRGEITMNIIFSDFRFWRTYIFLPFNMKNMEKCLYMLEQKHVNFLYPFDRNSLPNNDER